MAAIKICLMIPTMDRPKEINRLLKSIYSQSYLVSSIIVVDGSKEPIQPTLLIDERIPLEYIRCFPPSLTRQRNVGIARVPADVDYAGFLDDDIVLEDGAVQAIVDFIEKHGRNLGGVSFNIIEDGPRPPAWILQFLGLSATRPGGVSRGGSVNSNVGVKSDRLCEWLCGGATLWRRDVFQNFKFDEWYIGYALWEDVDFSYQVGLKSPLGVASAAKVQHLHMSKPLNEKSARFLGDVEIVDRFYFVTKHRANMSMLACVWASFGTVVRNALQGLRNRDKLMLYRISANFEAFKRCMQGKVQRRCSA